MERERAANAAEGILQAIKGYRENNVPKFGQNTLFVERCLDALEKRASAWIPDKKLAGYVLVHPDRNESLRNHASFHRNGIIVWVNCKVGEDSSPNIYTFATFHDHSVELMRTEEDVNFVGSDGLTKPSIGKPETLTVTPNEVISQKKSDRFLTGLT